MNAYKVKQLNTWVDNRRCRRTIRSRKRNNDNNKNNNNYQYYYRYYYYNWLPRIWKVKWIFAWWL